MENRDIKRGIRITYGPFKDRYWNELSEPELVGLMESSCKATSTYAQKVLLRKLGLHNINRDNFLRLERHLDLTRPNL